MKNFLIGLVLGVVLSGLTALVLIFAAVKFAQSFGERPVSVADASTLVFKLEGEVPEKSAPEIPLPILQEQTPMTVEQVWSTFHKAAADSRIKGIIFEPRGLEIGWAKMQEIHDEIRQADHQLSAESKRTRVLPCRGHRQDLSGGGRFARS